MRRNISTGIDIGSNTVRVVVLEETDANPYGTVLGIGSSINNGMRRGYVVNQEDTTEAIRSAVKAAERASGVQIRRAVVSLNSVSITSHVTNGQAIITRADSEVTNLDIEKAVQGSRGNLADLRNQKILTTIPIKFKLDGKEVLGRALGLAGNKLEVRTLFITCLDQHIKDTLSAFEDTSIDVQIGEVAPLAESLALLSKKQKNTGCVLIDIGGEATSMIMYENGIPGIVHMFPFGGADITNDIALGLKISIDDAEKIKCGQSEVPVSKKKLDEIINARLTDIFELVDAQLKKIGRSGLLPAGAVIVGGGAKVRGVADVGREVLKIPVTLDTPEIGIQTKGRLKDSNFAVAYGLSLLGLQNGDLSEETFGTSAKNLGKKFGDFFKQFLP